MITSDLWSRVFDTEAEALEQLTFTYPDAFTLRVSIHLVVPSRCIAPTSTPALGPLSRH